jgi:hypothetical protein
MRAGGHVYLNYGLDRMDEMALANIAPEDAELLDLRNEIAWKRRQQRLTKLYNLFFARVFSPEQKDRMSALFFRLQAYLRRRRRGERKSSTKDERS